MTDRLRQRFRLIKEDTENPQGNSLFTLEEKDAIAAYLKNPTSNGLVVLEGKWKPKGELRTFLANLLEEEKKQGSYTGKFEIDSWLQFTDSPYLLLYFFSRIVETESEWKGKNVNLAKAVSPALGNVNVTDDDGIVRPLKRQFGSITSQYGQAYQYFKKYLHTESLKRSAYSESGRVHTRDGFFIITRFSRDSNSIYAICLNDNVLKHINEFYRLIGRIDKSNLYTVYSPDDELLKPYVDILSQGMAFLGLDDSIKRQFKKMIDDFENESFMSCVNTAGLVAEEYLTQVYETLTRSPVPNNLMLGSLTNMIGEATSTLISPKKTKTPKTQREILEELKKLSSNKDQSKALISSNKLILGYFEGRIKEIEEKYKRTDYTHANQDFRIFPALIKQKLDDVIKYRNAASHKSTYPIDSHHAIRSIYASLGIVLWWDSQKCNVNGEKTKTEVAKELITRAKLYR